MNKLLFSLMLIFSIAKAGDVTPYANNDMACLQSFQHDIFACNYIKEAVDFQQSIDAITALDNTKFSKEKKRDMFFKLAEDKIFNLCYYYKNMSPINKRSIDNYEVRGRGGLQVVMDSEDALIYCYESHPGVAFVKAVKNNLKEKK